MSVLQSAGSDWESQERKHQSLVVEGRLTCIAGVVPARPGEILIFKVSKTHKEFSEFFNKMTQRLSVNPSCILIKLLTEPRLGSLSCFLSLVPLLSHISLALV